MAAVSDEFGLEVINQNDPPVFTMNIPMAMNFDEDSLLVFAVHKLWPFVYDPDNEDSSLNFYSLQSKNITISCDSLNFELNSAENWFGTDTVGIVVTDGEFSDTSSIVVTVNPVNDAPKILALPEIVQFESDTSFVLSMDQYELDIDTPAEKLEWNFSAAEDSLIFNFDHDKKELALTAPGFGGDVKLVCTLTDDSLASASDTILVQVNKAADPVTNITELEIPNSYSLSQNYPNPFNPATKIKIGLPKAGRVKVIIYNILGQKVVTLFDGFKPAGYHVISFEPKNLSSGIYFYQIQTKKFNRIKKMVFTK
jgi:hypothetical protein